MENIEIVEASINNYNEYKEIALEVAKYHQDNANWYFSDNIEDIIGNINLFQEFIENKNNKVFLAKYNGKYVGYASVIIEVSLKIPVFKERKFLKIDNIAIKEKYKRLGIGGIIIKEIEKFALEKNINQIELNVWDFNKGAINFYEKSGYEFYSHKMRKLI